MFARTRLAGWLCLAHLLAWGGCQPAETPTTGRIERTGGSQAVPTAPVDPATIREADAPIIAPDTHLAAGRLHESQGRLAAAVEQYQMAVNADPRHVEALNRLGVAMTRLGQYRKAERALQKAVELAPDQAHLLNNLAYARMAEGRWGEAAELLTRAVERFPDFPKARINLAVSLAMQGDDQSALEQFRLALPPEDAFYNMGMLYQSRREAVKAAHAYKLALQTNPRLAAARRRLESLPAEILGQADSRIEAGLALTADREEQPANAEPVALNPLPVETETRVQDGDAVQSVPALPAGGELAVSTAQTRPAGETGREPAAESPSVARASAEEPVVPAALTGTMSLETVRSEPVVESVLSSAQQSAPIQAGDDIPLHAAGDGSAVPSADSLKLLKALVNAIRGLPETPAWRSGLGWVRGWVAPASRCEQAASPPAQDQEPTASTDFMLPDLQAFSGEDPVP